MKGAQAKEGWTRQARHLAYTGAWKKMDWAWGLIIQAKRIGGFRSVLESVLAGFGTLASDGVSYNTGKPALPNKQAVDIIE